MIFAAGINFCASRTFCASSKFCASSNFCCARSNVRASRKFSAGSLFWPIFLHRQPRVSRQPETQLAFGVLVNFCLRHQVLLSVSLRFLMVCQGIRDRGSTARYGLTRMVVRFLQASFRPSSATSINFRHGFLR